MREIAVDSDLTGVDSRVRAQRVRQSNGHAEHLLDLLDRIKRPVLCSLPSLIALLHVRVERPPSVARISVVENTLRLASDTVFCHARSQQRSADEALVRHIEINLADLVLDRNGEPVAIVHTA